MGKLFRIAAILFILLSSMGCFSEREDYLDLLTDMERAEYRGEEISSKRIEEIKQGIEKYERIVEQKVEATSQIGIYYKMLAVQFIRGGMYQEAFKNLKQAQAIHTDNPILYYLSGVCAARISKAQVETEERKLWLERAESLYIQAIEIDPVYSDALYGLSVLLVFELNRSEEAEVLLKTLLSRETKHIDAMFLLGNVYYRSGRLEEALILYDKISRTTSVEEKKREAKANKERIEDELYGAR